MTKADAKDLIAPHALRTRTALNVLDPVWHHELVGTFPGLSFLWA